MNTDWLTNGTRFSPHTHTQSVHQRISLDLVRAFVTSNRIAVLLYALLAFIDRNVRVRVTRIVCNRPHKKTDRHPSHKGSLSISFARAFMTSNRIAVLLFGLLAFIDWSILARLTLLVAVANFVLNPDPLTRVWDT